MIDLTIVVPLEPLAASRPRAVAVNGQARVFMPKQDKRWASDFAKIVSEHCPEEILEGPLRLDTLSVIRRPQALMRKSDPPGLVECTKKPDRDNLLKAVQDALKEYWRDDAQIVAGQCLKAYAEKDGIPRTVFRLRDVPPGGVEVIARQLGLLPAVAVPSPAAAQLELVSPNTVPQATDDSLPSEEPAAVEASCVVGETCIAVSDGGGLLLEY